MATPNPHPTRGRRELVSWRLYRALTGVALLALVLAALAVQHPDAPSPPDQPVTVSGASVITAAQEQSTAEHTAAGGCCAAGSAGELAGATDMSEKLSSFDPKPELVQFASNLAWRSQPVPMINVIAYKPGTQAGIVAVIAHRDGGGVQPPIGSGLLVALGKALNPLKLRRGVVLVSTDGGTTGGQGADQFARTWPQADQIVSAITIDSIAGPAGATLRLATRTVTPRGTSPTLVAAMRQSATLVGGADPNLPSTINQLTGYAIPYAPTEQSPLLAHQVPAVSVSAGGGPTPQLFKQVNSKQVSQAASAIATLVVTLDTAPSIDRGGPPVVFAGVSVVRGWLLELALILLLVPSLACVLVLVGKARRRRVSLAPGMWALGWRLSTWLVGLLTIWLLTLAPGDLLPSISAPPLPHRTGVTTSGIVIVILVTAAYWRFVSRPRLRGSAASGGDRTIGLTTGLLGLMLPGVLLAAINPYMLIVILPAAHAWLWIAVAARAGRRGMALPYVLGFLGLVLVLGELWFGQDLGSQTPRAVLAMAASGYLSPAVTFCIAIAGAAACQIGALVLGRYAPVNNGARHRYSR